MTCFSFIFVAIFTFIYVHLYSFVYFFTYFFIVESLSATLSVNIWSTSPALISADSIDEFPIPFEATWPVSFTRYALAIYVDMLVAHVTMQTVRRFAVRMVRTRFLSLPPGHLELLTPPPEKVCFILLYIFILYAFICIWLVHLVIEGIFLYILCTFSICIIFDQLLIKGMFLTYLHAFYICFYIILYALLCLIFIFFRRIPPKVRHSAAAHPTPPPTSTFAP